MVRSIAVITFTVSLLFWTGQAFSDSPQEFPEEMLEMLATEDISCYPTMHYHPHVYVQQPYAQQQGHNQHGQLCPIAGHRHLIGQPCPVSGQGFGQRLGFGKVGKTGNAQTDSARAMAAGQFPNGVAGHPMTAGQFPNGVAGHPMAAGQFPNGVAGHPMIAGQYPNGVTGHPMTAGQFPNGVAGHPMAAGQLPNGVAGHPMAAGPAPNGFMGSLLMPRQYQAQQPPPMMGYGYVQGYPGSVPEQRIVYVPYAMPPPVYVERLGKALPRPPIMRRILGDAYMHEYPEMPLQLYTTRGPRDFLAPNPPSIGE